MEPGPEAPEEAQTLLTPLMACLGLPRETEAEPGSAPTPTEAMVVAARDPRDEARCPTPSYAGPAGDRERPGRAQSRASNLLPEGSPDGRESAKRLRAIGRW